LHVPGHQSDGNTSGIFITYPEEDAHKLDTAVVKGDILWQR